MKAILISLIIACSLMASNIKYTIMNSSVIYLKDDTRELTLKVFFEHLNGDVIYHIGLFEKTSKSTETKRLSFFFLGKNIAFKSIEIVGEKITVNCFERYKNQTILDKPRRPLKHILEIQNSRFFLGDLSKLEKIDKYYQELYSGREYVDLKLVYNEDYFVTELKSLTKEYIFVYFRGMYWCGTGGCSGEVLTLDRNIVTKVTDIHGIRVPLHVTQLKESKGVDTVIAPTNYYDETNAVFRTYYGVYDLAKKDYKLIYYNQEGYKDIVNALADKNKTISLFEYVRQKEPIRTVNDPALDVD